MRASLGPVLEPVDIVSLRPTQITVGLREVELKRRQWRERGTNHDEHYLGRHMVPVAIGPKGHLYVVDHHHLLRALHDEKVPQVLTRTVADLGSLDKPLFWTALDKLGLLHPFDAAGSRRDYEHIPESIADLVDDPYRSLAGELRRNGGYAKVQLPFAEFLWADYLRSQFAAADLAGDFDAVLEKALVVARQRAASYLPGWCGVDD
ncbi:MAG: chromosome partitioning protein ParB [Devosia sp.]|uniref:ParB-like protein n=1 Tax=Devosia sp. TaxID=1871048 RepID=UPI001AC0ADFE|nr:ParB-like protein [Devosia sp.]MBN9308596.1 chromosome partitioning protein ParB [Devosia sp.]MBN9314982.1 chromosome partitioning protein ParB [Devosia sp.]